MTNFDYALDLTLEEEGHFSDHPDDKGGATKYGISTPIFREAQERGLISRDYASVRDINGGDAEKIYKVLFWDAMRLDEITNTVIAAEIFDSGVNVSPRTAIKFAQRAINYLSPASGDITEDGIIGPATIKAINYWANKDERALFVALNGEQYIHYKNNPQDVFHRGWTKRVQTYREGKA